MYKAIQKFRDGENRIPFPQDKGGVVYEVGAEYPAKGFSPTENHIAYLLGCNFRGKGPVIEAIEDSEPPVNEPPAATVEAAEKMPEPENGETKKSKK